MLVGEMQIRSWILVFLGALLLFGGCRSNSNFDMVEETHEKAYQRGKDRLREGREQDALVAFLSVIDKRQGDAPESHLEVGLLYDDHFGDPVAAIYHYRKFLEQRPESEQAVKVKGLIEACKKDFARTLPAGPLEDDMERLDMLELLSESREEVDQLKQENASLRQRMARYQSYIDQQQATAQGAPEIEPVVTNRQSQVVRPEARNERPTVNGVDTNPPRIIPQTYTVQSGDSLYLISQKVYGSRARWREIFEANRDQLSSPHDLKVNQVLRLPR